MAGQQPQAGGPSDLVLAEDPASFTEPREQALAGAMAAFRTASTPVKGAEARVYAALSELRSLREFSNRVARLMETRGFSALPELVHNGNRLHGLRHLTVGPWRGVFLVGDDPAIVVALLFSRAPHDLTDRLDEIARPHRTGAEKLMHRDDADDDTA